MCSTISSEHLNFQSLVGEINTFSVAELCTPVADFEYFRRSARVTRVDHSIRVGLVDSINQVSYILV
jgi:hypothetical protein